MLNLLQGEQRRRAREGRWAEEQRRTAADCSVVNLQTDWHAEILSVAVTDAEREAVRCWLKGERHSATLAAALHVEHLPVPDQRRMVKQFKDRILKRLRRTLAAGGKIVVLYLLNCDVEYFVLSTLLGY